MRAARVSGLLLRLVADETHDHALFLIMDGFFRALAAFPEEMHEAAEMLAVLRMLAALGLDSGRNSGRSICFHTATARYVMRERAHYIARINRGITASGL